MPKKACFWTRKLELQLVEFVRQKDVIWKQTGNTNHHIQQKYKAYAEFASKLGRGFTARSVRDRWVNIRSTFNYNLRKVLKSKETAKTPEEVYVPCWRLWKPLQFLRDSNKSDNQYEMYNPVDEEISNELKQETEEDNILTIRQRAQPTDKPLNRHIKTKNDDECIEVLDNLINAMSPLNTSSKHQPYWFFGKHVTEMLNAMRPEDASCAGQEIMSLIENYDVNTKCSLET
ncbi:uncharacterized protein LOC126978188 [Leptidea sinapis]|uniref:uncharacterized protein LOC126978188 n=1 Tax=Leptidea sinapis TaxID=189913 RepID=UPI002145CA60|nr:uncharacterized protein LOC126978188 [Leptidea sinapis]